MSARDQRASSTEDDRRIARTLYTATGLINPLLDLAVDADPLGIKRHVLAEAVHQWRPEGVFAIPGTAVTGVVDALTWVSDAVALPGTPAWRDLSAQQRSAWWLNRAGSVTTALVATPGVFGVLADRLPVQDFLGFAQQAVLLCAVQREHGVLDRHRQTDLLAEVLCGRAIDSARLLDTSSGARAANPRSRNLVGTLRQLRSTYSELTDHLRARPAPRQPWRFLGSLPVVGVPADYVGERLALRRAGRQLVGALR